jgi:hypothetical protein
MSKTEAATLVNLIGDEYNDLTGYIGFPPFEQNYFEAPFVIQINLPTLEDVNKFNELLGCSVPTEHNKLSVKSIWFPELEKGERGSSMQYIWVEDL